MKRRMGILAAAAAALGLVAATAGAAVPAEGSSAAPGERQARGHVKPLPTFVEKWQDAKSAAADLVARGKAKPNENGRVRLPNGVFVDYETTGTDHIVTLLAEFTDPEQGQIPQPDRSVDNSTYWSPDFSPQHYRDLLFAPGGASYGMPSMRDFYLQLSSGRYTVEGEVSEWVQVGQPESAYGANSEETGPGGDDLNGPVYRVVRDALLATASTNENINWDPAVVDVWDRYDCDGDGNFDEPDGYVDHFQIVHAGEGEEAGGGAQGGDAIWSHRWYANFNEDEGPADCQLGGYPVPGTGLWVGDYTIEPENGAVGVFSHEFAHDLGLPDLYDTAGGENGTGFWTLMSSGSWASNDPNAIDTKPVHMGAWEKLVLGWLEGDLALAALGDDKTVDLGPAEGNARHGDQALRVNLPDYEKTTTIVAPEGSDPFYYYSGSGDNLDVRMTRQLGTPLAAPTPLTFRTWYDIETDWDYAYVEAFDGTAWAPVDGNLSTDTNPHGQNFGHGITGTSAGWVDGDYVIPAGTTAVRFRYWSDGAVAQRGFVVDSIALEGVFTDDGSTPEAWTLDGFTQVENGEVTAMYFHYYLVESRSYVRNDVSLCGAYNFVVGNFLEKQCYADGLLVTYRNSAYTDNNTSEHPGFGQVLPVDSHPAPRVMPDRETYWRTRWQTWDSTFGLDRHSVRLSQIVERNGKEKLERQRYNAAPVSRFHDSSPTKYWDARIPQASVQTAGSGLRIDVLEVSKDRTTYRVWVH